MLRPIAGLACIGCICLAMPAIAAARVDDRRSAATYLQAKYALSGLEVRRIGASAAAIEEAARRIERECPSLAEAPEGSQLDEFGMEIRAVVFFAAAKPDRGAMLVFAAKIVRLSWSERRIAELVRSLAVEERMIASLGSPNVCADLKAWRDSGYRTLPQSTVQFVKQVGAIGGETSGGGRGEESLEDAIVRALQPYESRGERRLARWSQRRDKDAGKRLLRLATDALHGVEQALGIKGL